MVRQTGRSRGCKTCRKRKIKCDEEAPICRQCSNAGVECGGPILGSVFIDMAENIKRDRESKKAKAASARCDTKTPSYRLSTNVESSPVQRESAPGKSTKETKPLEPSLSFLSMAGAASRDGSLMTEAVTLDCDVTDCDASDLTFQFRLPLTYAPNATPVLEQLYLSNLIASYSCPEGQRAGLHIWTSDLPRMLSSTKNQTFIWSSRATSMALYARLTKSESAALQARGCYAKCLQLQTDIIQLGAKAVGRSAKLPTLASIVATCLLAIFESTVATAPDGWVHHFSAAIRMLLLKGPEACQRGLGNQIFRSLRLGSVVVGMTTREPSPFDQPEWHDLPFASCEKTPVDILVDILVQLPSCSSKIHRWQNARSWNESVCLKRQILQQTESLLLGLDLMSELYDIECFDTAFQATFVALFRTACLICLNYQNRVASPGKTTELQMEEHAEMILKCAAYHKKAGIHSGGSFNMSFPLKIASLMAPSEHIRLQAQGMILNWGDQRGITDLFQAAYPVCT